MPATRWPRVEATILRHLACRSSPTATAAAIADATGLPEGDVTYALEALYEDGEVDTLLDGGGRRWRLKLPDADDRSADADRGRDGR